MSGEFDVEVRNAIRALRTEVESLSKSQDKLNDSVRRYAQEANGAFNKNLKLPVEHTEKLGRAMHELGHAVRYLGGPLGDIAHKLTGGAGLEGGFSKVAVAAGAVGLAIEGIHYVMERHSEDVKRAIESEEEWAKAIDKGREIQNRQAEQGLGQAAGRRRLLAAGGGAAVDSATELSKRLAGVSTPEDSEKATADIYAKYGNTPRAKAALGLVGDLAETGSFTASEAAQELIKFGGSIENRGVGRRVAGFLYAQKTGRTGNPDGIFGAARLRVRGDDLLGAARQAGLSELGKRETEARQAIESGPVDAMNRAAEASNPILNQLRETHNIHAQSLQKLEKIGEYHGVLGFFSEIMDQFKFNVSLGTIKPEYVRAQEAFTKGSSKAGEKYGPGE